MTREIIHVRTNGNPFFIEEVVQSLVEGAHLAGRRGAYRLATPIEMLQVSASSSRPVVAHRSAAGAREAGVPDRRGNRQNLRRGAARPGDGERHSDRRRGWLLAACWLGPS